MTFDDILAFDDLALLLAIERFCYGRTWRPVDRLTYWHGHHQITLTPPLPYAPYWIQEGDDPADVTQGFGSQGPPYPHFTDWNLTMPLAWTYRIGVWPLSASQDWLIEPSGPGPALHVETEEEARRAVCRVAVWLALDAGPGGMWMPREPGSEPLP